MPDFSRIIAMAYLRILGRPPDPGGLDNYNQAMNGGLTEALMRESLLRSSEYAAKNPSLTLRAAEASTPAASPGGGRSARKSNSKKKRR